MYQSRLPPTVINGVTVDFEMGTLRDATGAEIPLRAQSFAVLHELVRHAGILIEKGALIEAVWKGVAVTDDSLVQCIGEIRRALGDNGQRVVRTVPRRGYRLVVPEIPVDAGPPIQRGRLPLILTAATLGLMALVAGLRLLQPPAPAETPPSIAVLPFVDMSAKGDLRYMGAGVAEDIIAMLARSPDVVVMARNSSFSYGAEPVDVRRVGEDLGADYVLEGSVRREGDRMRLTAQLNDAETGRHVWAERFDEAGSDPPALQDSVTGRIIASLTGEVGELKRAQFRKAWGKDTARLGEYDYFLRGLDIYMNARSKEDFDRAGALYREGLGKYPDSALLKVKLGWYHWTLAWDFWSDDLAADFDAADRLVTEVLATDNLTPEVRRSALWLNAHVLMYRGDFAGSVREAEATVALAPYDARVLKSLSYVMMSSGEYDRALEWLDAAETRNPKRKDDIAVDRANVLRVMGRSAEALEIFRSYDDMTPYMTLSVAIAQVRMGEINTARDLVGEALADDPGFTRTLWRKGSFYRDPAILDGEIADLATAGLPE